MAGMVPVEASILGDEMIMEQILATHAPNGTKLDVKSLLNIITNILNRASHIVDGAITGTQAHLEKVENKPYNLEFETPPIVEKLSCQMMCSCKASDHSNLHETTLSVFSHLSGYSWDAKVVVALSAYAVNYGDFWLLEQIYPQDQLAMPMAVLKRQTVLNKPPAGALKSRIVAISTLTKIILEVTQRIAEIEKLSVKNNPMDVPALVNAMAALPMAVYSTIKTVIACASQITSLTATTNESQTTLLLTLTPKLNMTLVMLKELLIDCWKEIEENRRYQMLLKLTHVTHTDNIEVLKAIICTKNDILIDLSTKRTVKVDYLRKKHVLLLISGLDISSHVIATLKQTYEGCRMKGNKGYIPRLIGGGQEYDQYSFEVVWVPVVEQWSLEAIQRFDLVKAEMPWYTVHNFLSSVTDSAVLKFYKQVWQYQGKPIAPVISHQGNFESPNALHVINVWGSKAFPFTETRQVDMWKEHTKITMELIMGDTHPDVTTWIQNEQFVLFYGGTDTKWTNITLQEVAKSFHEKMKKSVVLVNVHRNMRFWDRIESLLACKMENEVDEVMHKMQELLGYKKEEKWGMLCMGSNLLISGLGDSIVDALSQDVDMDDPSEWVIALIESYYYDKVTSLDSNCCHYRFPANAGWVPQSMKCVKCHRVMERFVTFQCCHKDREAAANGPC